MIDKSDIKGLIFDYGGTLDTGGCHWGKRIWHGYEHAGVPVSEDMFRQAYVYAERELAKNPIIQSDYTFYMTLKTKVAIQMEYLAREGCNIRAEQWLNPVVDALYEKTRQETKRSVDTIKWLSKRYPMVLVSNFYGNIHTVLSEMGFDGYFSQVIESAVVGVRKPNPEIFILGVKALGMDADNTLVVGDSYDKDIVPAHQAGCHTVWIQGEPWTEQPIEGNGVADAVITELEELTTIL